ncbi:peptide deformylase [Acidimangrovimonas pyrenivorans]|uniref:Peptide deformylase n=1 Tax=Acidimangrovimonas pyrenivorans TaxID=2030798 RepID=A0ABV7AC39_9RHOB
MADRPILLWPDARLRQQAAPVEAVTDDLRELADEMLRIMYAAPGRGLSGPQIGVMRRIFVMDAGWKEGAPEPRVMLNPEIVHASAETAMRAEGCLSLPGLTAEVARPAEVTLRFTGLDGAVHEETFTGFAATCVQHERDHLDGILCIDHLAPEDREAVEPALQALERA